MKQDRDHFSGRRRVWVWVVAVLVLVMFALWAVLSLSAARQNLGAAEIPNETLSYATLSG